MDVEPNVRDEEDDERSSTVGEKLAVCSTNVSILCRIISLADQLSANSAIGVASAR